VALDAVEDGWGATRLSREKAKRNQSWLRLDKAFEAGELVTAASPARSRAASPSRSTRSARSCLARCRRPSVRDTAYLENKDLEFKVIKLDRKRNNVVVSRRAVVEQEYSAEREALLSGLQEAWRSRASSRT